MQKGNETGKCPVEWCSRMQDTGGYCWKHYVQIRKHGIIRRTRYDKNTVRIQRDYVEMELTDKNWKLLGVVIFDKEDLTAISEFKWHAKNTTNGIYAYRDKRPRALHRFILKLTDGDGKLCDHINHNTLDNRRCNLRIVDATRNARNMSLSKKSTSGYIGVKRYLKTDKWYAGIHADGHYHMSRLCKTKEEAVIERKKLEDKYWGDKR